jgi:hypothetical protein
MPRDLESVIAEVMRATVYKTRPSEDENELRTHAVAAAVREYLLSDEAVERAAGSIWTLDRLSCDEARDELRRDVRAALAAALGDES